MKGKGYYIGERAGVLERKHIKAMGPSRWLFSWAIRRQTGTSREGWGIVLYGNTITYDVICTDLGTPITTLRRWMTRLIKQGYVKTIRKPHGFKLFIAKPKKTRDQSSTKRASFPQSDSPKMDDHDSPKMDDHSANNGLSLMDDHSQNQYVYSDIQEKVDDHRSIKVLEVKVLRRKEMLPPSASGYLPSLKVQSQRPKPTPPKDVILGEIAAIAGHKEMPRAGPMSDLEFDRRRQRMKLDLENHLARAQGVIN